MATTPASSNPDTLVLTLSEDAYLGDAQFSVTLDGMPLGAAQTVTASHKAGAQQSFTIQGNWGAGPHKVAVKYLNDAYGGTSATDRNLYLTSAEYDGNPYADVGTGMYSAGEAAQFTVQAPGPGGSATPTPAPAAASVPAPVSASPSTTTPAPSSSPHMSLVGVNLAGPAFAPQNVPGVLGTDYVYPTHNEVDYFASKGMNVFRLSFLMERLEPAQNGPFDAAELARIDDVVNYAGSKGIKVILDPHDFGQAYGNDIGSAGTPASTLTNFNAKLAAHYASTPNVIFGLMNEPHNQSAAQWEPIAQDSVNAIRAAGATSQEILVPGTYWQNAKNWTTSDNAAAMGKVTDPNHNMAYELHMYVDAGSGGAQPDTVSPTIGVERIADATKWAEATGNRLFLGEFGVSGDSAGLAALSNTLTYMDQHSDAWQGAAYWAAGPAWGSMFMSIEPSGGPGNYTDKPQMGILTQHLPMA